VLLSLFRFINACKLKMEIEMSRAALKVVVLLATLFVGIDSARADGLVDATDPARLLGIAKGFGTANLEKSTNGDPKIAGRLEGVKYGIYFFGCTDNSNCDDIQFATAWAGAEVSEEKINEWNKTKRYGKAYLDDEGDPHLEMDVNIHLGVSEENLSDTFEWWGTVLRAFKKEVLQQ
jgi:Putative bacterial sensory transduction regulator